MDPLKNNKFNLDDLKKEHPFQVPEHYFDSLGARISDRIEASDHRRKEFAFSRLKLRPILVFSGGFAGIFLVIYFGFSAFFKDSSTIKNQINNEMENLSEYALVSGLDEATLVEEFSTTGSSQTDSLKSEHKDNIIDYLVKENIDISTIIEEL
jgi:hypothetical protein